MERYCGLDVHKDSVFVCIMDENGIVFQEKFGVLTFELEKLRERCQLVRRIICVHYRCTIANRRLKGQPNTVFSN